MSRRSSLAGFCPEENVTLHTGNLLSSKIKPLYTKAALSKHGFKNEELFHVLTQLTEKTGNFDHIHLGEPYNRYQLPDEPCSISLKLFLSPTANPSIINHAIDAFSNTIIPSKFEDSEKVNIFVISFPKVPLMNPCCPEDEGLEIEESANIDVSKFVQATSHLAETNRIAHWGVADVNLVKWKDIESMAKVAPTIANQNYRPNCPKHTDFQFVEYCDENDILLLTHTDKSPYITSDQLSSLTVDKFERVDAVLRYNIIAKTRAVGLAKGYLIFGKMA